MRTSHLVVGIGIVVASLVAGPGAFAVPPVTTPVPFQETFPGTTRVCDFPITVEFNTRQVLREWVKKSGEVAKATTTGPGHVTITNDRTGDSVTAEERTPQAKCQTITPARIRRYTVNGSSPMRSMTLSSTRMHA